jgi:CMP-N,N'-diacetyllegionaminic acid synthase
MASIQGDVIAVVPARGGSKGIRRKNLVPLAGVPLVVWAIRAALEAKRVTRTVVSTEDDEIATVAREAGAEVVRRPADLASDEATTMPVLNHVLDNMTAEGFAPDVVALVEPTSPFRQPCHIDTCVEMLSMRNAESVVTVTQLERNPFNIFRVHGSIATRFIEELPCEFTNRQEFRILKRINGCVYVTWSRNIRAGKLVVDPIEVLEMAPERSVNIDTPLDLEFAEHCAKNLKKDAFS